MTDLDKLVSEAIARFGSVNDAAELERVKARYLGKSGELSALQSTLKTLPPEGRREFGAKFNSTKLQIESALETRRAGARIGSGAVGTLRVGAAGRAGGAFIDIGTILSVGALESRRANAGIGAGRIGTLRVRPTGRPG